MEKRRVNIVFAALVVAFAAVVFSGCNEKPDTSSNNNIVKTAKSSKKTDGTVLLLMGTNNKFWNQIVTGAEMEAVKHNLRTVTVFRQTDESNATLVNSLNDLDSYVNLRGIVIAGGDESLEKVISTKNPSVPIVFVDQMPSETSAVRNMKHSSVVPDNIALGKALAGKIDGKVITLRYTIGATYDRVEGIKMVKGNDNVIDITASMAEDLFTNFRQRIQKGTQFDGVIITTGDVIEDRLIDLVPNKPVCCVDMNANVARFIRSGALLCSAIPDTYEMGAKAVNQVLSTDSTATVPVPVIWVDRTNVDSDEIKKFLR